jgi:hypothetical protein
MSTRKEKPTNGNTGHRCPCAKLLRPGLKPQALELLVASREKVKFTQKTIKQ